MCGLLVGCEGLSGLPSRETPIPMSVKQIPGVNDSHPSEYVLCDIKGGAWGCDTLTPKNNYSSVVTNSTESISRQEKISISKLVNNAIKQVAPPIQASVNNKKVVTQSSVSGEGDKNTSNQTSKTKSVPLIPPIAVIYFDFDSSVLNKDGDLVLSSVLEDLPGKSVELHGYTDNIGSEAYNTNLGLDRAISVKTYFEKLGSNITNIQAYGHGLCCYVGPNTTSDQRAKNRRVEIYIAD